MERKYTAGEWDARPNGSGDILVSGDHPHTIAVIGTWNPNAAADAALIAAAPMMAEALAECADYLAEFMEEGRAHRVIAAADAALRAAGVIE
jgi:hypothetical protein